jgi:hypothetical protein
VPPPKPDERLYGTTAIPNPVEKVAGSVKDALKKGYAPNKCLSHTLAFAVGRAGTARP